MVIRNLKGTIWKITPPDFTEYYDEDEIVYRWTLENGNYFCTSKRYFSKWRSARTSMIRFGNHSFPDAKIKIETEERTNLEFLV